MTIEHEHREAAHGRPEQDNDTARMDDDPDEMVDRHRDADADNGQTAAPDLDSDLPGSTTSTSRVPDREVTDEQARYDEAGGPPTGDDTRVDDHDISDVAVNTHDTGIEERDTARERATPGETGEISSAGGPLLTASDLDRIRERWHELQHGFVDDPRHAVDDAAKLVSLAADHVIAALRDQMASLDAHRSGDLAGNGEPDTEELRTLMRSYHEVLDRLLAV